MTGSSTVLKWSRDKIVHILCNTALFGGLSAGEIDRIAELSVPVAYSAGQVVFVIDEEPHGMYIIAEGSVRSVRQSPDGREQVLSVEYPCSTIAEVPVFDRGRCFSTTIAQGETKLLFIGRSDIHRLCADYPALLRRSMDVMASRVREYAELVHTLSLRDVDRRVAWFVLQEAVRRGVRTDAGVALELTATHQEIACRVGSVREMVTRALGHLQRAGLLAVRGRLILIPDEARLADYAIG